MLGAKSFTEESSALTLASETDRVYTPPNQDDGSAVPLTVNEDGAPKFRITRDALPNVTVWNPWNEKAAAMGEFSLSFRRLEDNTAWRISSDSISAST